MLTLAIDSGGTKVVGAVVDAQGSIIEKKRIMVPERDGDCLVRIFLDIIEAGRKKYRIDLIGIGANGRIDPERGVITDCGVYRNWEGRHLAAELFSHCRIPVSVHNDCSCAIKGELWRGAIRGKQSVAGMIIGTGLGGAILDRGEFIRGSCYGAGEVGHMILHAQGKPCYCGQCGCAERYVSGTALWESYNERAGVSQLHSGYAFFDRYTAGDPLAGRILDNFVEDLALLMTSIANLCAPEVFLIGGGIGETHALWSDALQQSYRKHVGTSLKDTQIVYASRGNDSALLGAAAFALEAHERGYDK